MNSIEATGKTVKEAISKGLAELGCGSADVDIQVIEMGSPGLFGIFGKPARVKLTRKGNSARDELDIPVLSIDTPRQRREKKPEAPKAEPAEAASEEPSAATSESDANGEPKPARKRRHRSRGGHKNSEERAAQTAETSEAVEETPRPMLTAEPFVETPEEELSDTARAARAFLKELTDRMEVPADIAVGETEEQLRMVLSGENMSILIGRRGETLDALQYLTSLNVNRGREDYLRVSLDTENYRAKREEALRKLAVRMANRCRKSGRRVALEPMNPYERRILHSALQGDPDVTTHSEGEEPYRRVIITLK